MNLALDTLTLSFLWGIHMVFRSECFSMSMSSEEKPGFGLECQTHHFIDN